MTEVASPTRTTNAVIHFVTDLHSSDYMLSRSGFDDVTNTLAFLRDFSRAAFIVGALSQKTPLSRFQAYKDERQALLKSTGSEPKHVDVLRGIAWIFEPRITRLSMESPLDVVTIVEQHVLTWGGLTGTLLLAQRILTFPVRLSERWAKHEAEIAKARVVKAEAEAELHRLTHELSEHTYRPSKMRAISIYDQDEDDPLDEG